MRPTMLMVVLAWMLAGCRADLLQRSSGPAGESGGISAHAGLGDTIRLRPGQVAEAGAREIRIAFSGVSGESRCPRGVACVWSGDATVQVELMLRRGSWSSTELHTHLEPKQILHGGYTVALLDLEPYPVYGEHVRAEDYVAVFRVTR